VPLSRFLFLLLLPLLVPAQGPVVGIIDFYGRQKVSEEKLLKVLGVKPGQMLPRSKGDVEDALEEIEGVVYAHLEAACCDEGKAILYVGIEERGAPHFIYSGPPAGLELLPMAIHDEYAAFLAALGLAVREGDTAEDLTQGHSLMRNSGARSHQEKFVELARDHLPDLKKVLQHSENAEHRAIAAYVIGYAPKKQLVVEDLQRALRDPDDTVRNNATRSLAAIAVYAQLQPDQELRISPTWFIEALNSLIWQDRITAANTLVGLTEKRDPLILDHLRERAMPALRDMASWKYLPHALPGFLLLGRVAGMPESEIRALWEKGDRISLLKRVDAKKR